MLEMGKIKNGNVILLLAGVELEPFTLTFLLQIALLDFRGI